MMEYKGYVAHVVFDDSVDVFHGEVVNTQDVITFQGRTVDELRKAFEESVDDYLEFCKEDGVEPEKPYSGRFVVRMSPDLHRRTAIAAKTAGKSMNAYLAACLEKAVRETRFTAV